jgi:flavin-dependent dehydrogenase
MEAQTHSPAPEVADVYDVVVMGGALAGGATATLLLRHNPGIRVLVLEKTTKLGRRVGEATVEVSAYFMGRVLGLTQYLNESQLAKQGLRFWFKNDEVNSLAEASELGPLYQVRVPSYQLDRATFDEEVLRRAAVAGAQVVRPVTITDVQLSSGGEQTVTFKNGAGPRTVRARWVVDASGVAAILARKNGWWVSNTEHPTAAAWSRWKGVKDWDSRELAEKYPQWSRAVYATRNTATNHVIGDGWWSWWIPLKGGDVSVGVVIDQRLVDWPQDGGNIGERLKTFLMKHPVGREILVDAEFDEEDMHWRRNLAYYSTTHAGDGFVLVGDAAAFMDPFYSPGMDWISFTTSRAAAMITAQRKGEPVQEWVDRHNRDFVTCHRCWFEAVYKDKYEYMAEWDLMSTAFLFDLCLYYIGVASRPFKYGETALLVPPFSATGAGPIFRFMSAYNRRFAEIARRRRKRGTLGQSNRANRCLVPGFKLHSANSRLMIQAFFKWAKIEIGEFLAPSQPETAPVVGLEATAAQSRE